MNHLSKKLEGWTPETPEAQALLQMMPDLEAGKIVMTRKLLLEVIDCAENLRMSSVGWSEWEMIEATEQWREGWVLRAKPEWLDVLAEILVNPPKQLKIENRNEHGYFSYSFQLFFKGIALRFPAKAFECIALLTKNKTTHPLLADLLFTE